MIPIKVNIKNIRIQPSVLYTVFVRRVKQKKKKKQQNGQSSKRVWKELLEATSLKQQK